MRKFQNTTLLLLLACLATILHSCETVVTFPLPDIGERIVLNSTIMPGNNAMSVNLSASRGALENEGFFRDISDASVRLYEDGVFIDELSPSGPGTYFYSVALGDPLFSEGKRYRLEVDAPEMESISAETDIPMPAVNVETRFEDTLTIGDRTFLSYSIHFDDPANEENYYFVDMVESSLGSYCFGSRDNDFVSYEDAFGDIDNEVPYYCGQQFFSDKTFNGGDPDIEILIDLQEVIWLPATPNFTLLLGSLSEDHYLHRTTTELQYFTMDNPFAQPVTIYSNVENGFGAFTSFTMQAVDF